MITAKIIKITGLVQGVFFRKSAQQQADIMGILGTVKNEADGSITIQAVGDAEPMKRFMEWCHKGPSEAQVNEVIIEDLQENTQFRRFEIIYD